MTTKLAPKTGNHAYIERYWVPDLLPRSRNFSDLIAIFIGESPHRDEVAPESVEERSPFRGVAGREWWSELVKFIERPIPVRPVPPRRVLEEICTELKIAVMNAVQFPIDPKIVMHQGSASTPRDFLGFEKGAGEWGYARVLKQEGQKNPVRARIEDLAERLQMFKGSHAQLVCLGHDSRWFVERAIQLLPKESPLLENPIETVPHPSSWWRNAAYRAKAVRLLEELLSAERNQKSA